MQEKEKKIIEQEQPVVLTPDQIRQIVREEVAHFMSQSKYIFDRPVQIMDGNDITLGQTHGTRIGTSATQKIGFFGATPVTQLPAGYLIAATGGATIDYEARARISDLNAAFTLFGLAP